MSSNKHNTFSFNNFKSFGEEMQTFSKKPITLIYGPNSVGKSSLMHASLYNEYLDSQGYILKSISMNIDLKQSNFAGDVLDLGGFENFVHKKDSSNEVVLSTKLNNKKDIAKILPKSYEKFLEFEKEGLFEFINNLGDNLEKVILEKINNFQMKENCFYYSQLQRNMFLVDLLASRDSRNYKLFQENNATYQGDLRKAYELCIASNDTLEDITQKKDDTPLDILDKAILFFLDNSMASKYFYNETFDIETMTMFIGPFKFYEYIAKIKNIRLDKVIIKPKDEKVYLLNRYYINDELLFELAHKDNKLTYTVYASCNFWQYYLSTLSPAFGEFPNDGAYTFDFTEYEIGKINGMHAVPSVDSLDKFISLHILSRDPYYEEKFITRIIKNIVRSFSKDVFENAIFNKNQYIGPLRWVPNRYDLLQDINYAESKNFTQNNTLDYYLKKNFTKSIYTMNKLMKYIPKIKYIYYLFGPVVILYFTTLEIIKSWKDINFSNLKFIMLTPYIKNNKNKVSKNGAKTSEKMWMDFIASSKTQDEINTWLSNEDKLKSNYKVEISEVDFKKSIFSRYKPMKQLNFIDQRTNTNVHPKDMGLGISQVLPVLISAKMSEDTQIFLEQPELHLHPKVQAELADEFIKSAKKENGNSFMIETHSEHLLLRIMRRMRYTAENKEGRDKSLDLTPDDVCLLYVDSDGNSSYINELRLSKKGTLLDHWPNGFFEEGHKERFS